MLLKCRKRYRAIGRVPKGREEQSRMGLVNINNRTLENHKGCGNGEERFIAAEIRSDGAEVLTAQADVFVPQNHPGRRRRAGTKTEEKGKKKLPGLSPALRSSEAAEDSQEWLSHLPRNEGHDIPAAARNLRYRARTKKAAGLKPGATKLGGGREQPRMAVPPSRFGP